MPHASHPSDHMPTKEVTMRRHTTARIVIYALTLQAALSLVSSATYLAGYWGEWDRVLAAYPAKQRWLWFVALLWSLAAFASGAALVRRRAWGRTLYVSAGSAAVIAYFVLQPWMLALSAVPMIALTSAILLSRLGADYLAGTPCATATPATRTRLAIAVLAASTIMFTVSYLGTVLRLGWMAELLYRPGLFLAGSLIGLAVAATAMPDGKKGWAFGVGLMVPVVIMAGIVLGYLPYASPLVRFLGAGYREYAIDSKMINTMQMLFGILALVLLRKSGGKRDMKPLTWPDQH